MELPLDQALQNAIEAHKNGQVQEADRLYTAILKAQPKHPDGNHNMGVLAVGVGKIEEALPFYKVALEANPSVAQYWLSYIDALIQLNKLVDAKAVLAQAKVKGAKGNDFHQLEERLATLGNSPILTNSAIKLHDPPQDQIDRLIDLYGQGKLQQTLDECSQLLKQFSNSVILHNISGAANNGLGQLDAAIESYNKALSFKPNYAESHCNMGIALKKQGKLKEAVESYNKALSFRPNYADAYYNMGITLKDQGKLEEALEAYSKALAIKPEYAEVYNNIGIVLQEVGEQKQAVEAYSKAISIKPGYALTYYNMGSALQSLVFKQPNKFLQKIITAILDQGTYVRPNKIANAAISLLKFDPILQKHLEEQSVDEFRRSLKQVVLELSELPLLLKLMSVCPIADLQLEKLLKEIRSMLLSGITSLTNSPEVLKFQSALALQCFTNEYIYTQSELETKALEVLEAKVGHELFNGQQSSPQAILCLASYTPLGEYKWCEHLISTMEIDQVFTRQVLEPKLENQLKSTIPVLEDITDNISSKVRKQYEESPYPRWVNLGLPLNPLPLSEEFDAAKLRISDKKIFEVDIPDILVAGCGTGQHSIGTAVQFQKSKVLAIDLSLSSLAYAKRKTEELSVRNIEYMQADILNLSKLNRQFDIIESAGVLHHMDDPIAGWRALTNCLKPGGLMRIGLYSELARQDIVKMREGISQSGISLSDIEIKSFRTDIINSDKVHHKQVMNSIDFYSLSALRDLLFHVQEHRFTISQIKNCFSELGLKLCGFESKDIRQHFQLTNTGNDNPYDLDKWQIYEEANPKAFTEMYQFWCEKIA